MFDESCHNSEVKTDKKPTVSEIVDMDFGIICAKHLKSNTIVLVKDKQMLGMGCGHPDSRLLEANTSKKIWF